MDKRARQAEGEGEHVDVRRVPASDVPLDDPSRLGWERACVAAARHGDRGAFAALYRAYAPAVLRRVLIPKLGARDVAEDALAETFRRGYEALGRWEDRGLSIYHWFSRIAVNQAMDHHRKRAREARGKRSYEHLLAPVLPGVEAPGARLEAAGEARVLRERIAVVMGELRPRYRQAIELRFLEGRSRQECAEALEVKIGTFDVLILRALRSFRSRWDVCMTNDASGEVG